jgi:hypothetical protein
MVKQNKTITRIGVTYNSPKNQGLADQTLGQFSIASNYDKEMQQEEREIKIKNGWHNTQSQPVPLSK